MKDFGDPGNLRKQAVVGPTINIKGKVSGDQDLLIQGRIEGQVSFPGHSITVAREGRVKADLVAKVIRIDGHVTGSIQGEEQIRVTGRVRGPLSAPQVILEEGCYFSGTIDSA